MSQKTRGTGRVPLEPFQDAFKRIQLPYQIERHRLMPHPRGAGTPRQVITWIDSVERAGEVSAADDVALRLGWMRSSREGEKPDATRVLRTLGLRASVCGKTGKRVFRRALSSTMAVMMADGLLADPFEVGI